MRKLMSIVLIGMLALTGISLSRGQAADEVKPEVMQLSLQKSVDLALKNNIDLKQAELNVNQQKLAYKMADNTADKISDNSPGTYQGLLTEKFTPEDEKMALAIAERSYEMQQKGMEIKVKKAYYTILLRQREVAAKKGALDHAKRQHEIATLKFNQGMVAKHDVLAAEVQFKTKENEWAGSKREFQKVQMDFKQLLNLDVNQNVQLTDDFNLNNKAVSLEDSITNALEKRLDMLQVREKEALYALNLELAGDYYTPNVWTYKQAAYQYEQKKMDLEKQVAQVKVDVNKAYLDLNGSYEALEPAQKNVEQAKESLRIVNLQYKNGLATTLDVLNAQNMLENMEMRYANAVFAYTMSAANFDFAVNHGSPVQQ